MPQNLFVVAYRYIILVWQKGEVNLKIEIVLQKKLKSFRSRSLITKISIKNTFNKLIHGRDERTIGKILVPTNSGVIYWLLFHFSWKNYVLNWYFGLKSWIGYFFTCYTNEKAHLPTTVLTPWQNKFSHENRKKFPTFLVLIC